MLTLELRATQDTPDHHCHEVQATTLLVALAMSLQTMREYKIAATIREHAAGRAHERVPTPGTWQEAVDALTREPTFLADLLVCGLPPTASTIDALLTSPVPQALLAEAPAAIGSWTFHLRHGWRKTLA